MTRSKPIESERSHRSGENIPCAKCGHENPAGSNTCGECEAHLWVVCHHCGHRNRRVDGHCVECARRLHRSLWRRASKKLFGNRRNITAWQIVTLAVGVWLAYKIVIFFAEYRPPPLE